MTSEQLEREERASKIRHRAENYSMLVMIACGFAGAGLGAIAGGEITRINNYSSFFQQHYYLGDMCRVGVSALFAAGGAVLQDNLDPIKKYLDKRAKLSELEFKKNKK